MIHLMYDHALDPFLFLLRTEGREGEKRGFTSTFFV